MAKLPINPFFLLSRRSLRVQAMKKKSAAVAAKEAVPPTSDNVAAAEKKKENFWMRDPKTGNWIPESQVGDHAVDEVEQRERLLPKKIIFRTN